MNLAKIIITICSLLFIMVGLDKFLSFLEPPCSLQNNIPEMVWYILGALQLVAAILIWLPQYRRYVVGFFFVFMLFFTIIHLVNSTYDIGGSAFMAALLGLLLWNPSFIHTPFFKGKK